MCVERDLIDLTDGELELLRALATDDPVDVVARRLGVSQRTLRRYSRALFDKLGVAGRVEAAVWAATHGVLRPQNRCGGVSPRMQG